MTKVDQMMTPAEYARHRGCSKQAVSRALQDGRIGPLVGGKLDPVAADAQWQARSRPRVRAHPPAAGEAQPAAAVPRSYDDSRARQAAADADMAELRLAELERKLVRVDQARDWADRTHAACRQVLLDLPLRLAVLVAAESDAGAVQRLLHAEMVAALRVLSEIDDRLAEYERGADPAAMVAAPTATQ